MWIDRPRGEAQIAGGTLPGKQFRVFLGFERPGSARISSRTVVRPDGVGDIPAVWLGHLPVLSCGGDGWIYRSGRTVHSASEFIFSCATKTIKAHRRDRCHTVSQEAGHGRSAMQNTQEMADESVRYRIRRAGVVAHLANRHSTKFRVASEISESSLWLKRNS